MPSFTSGPWRVEEGRFVYGGYGFFQRIAEIEGCNGESNLDTKREDLDLIAAAPDLLDALRLMESVYRQNAVSPGEPSSVLEAAQAAIAKAEGK